MSKRRGCYNSGTVNLQDEIRRAQELGQSLEDLVVQAGQVTIKADGSQLLIGFWSLIFDYQKGLLNVLLCQFYAAAFALWRPIVEATIRAHLTLMLSKKDLDLLKKDKYKVDFTKVPGQIDEAYGLGQVFQNFLPEPEETLCTATHTRGLCRSGGASMARMLQRTIQTAKFWHL